jgi:hypothetical protein
MHPTPFGQAHYHSWSPCLNGGSYASTFPKNCPDDQDCAEDVIKFALKQGFTDTTNYGGIVGIAKDGHLIYGPYNESGREWACSERDACNGRFFPDGSYGYVSTKEHPYIVGCWGPGPRKRYLHTCSKGTCGVQGSSNSNSVISLSTLAAAAFISILF